MKSTFFAFLVILLVSNCSPAQTIVFGLNINDFRPLNGQPPKVSFDSYRFWDDGSQWSEINTANGYYDFSVTSNWLQALRQSGVNDVLFELGLTPQWASSNPNDKSCDYANYGVPGQCAPPKDLNADGTGPDMIWRQWCKAVGQFFSSNPDILVRAWSPWNEFTRHVPTDAWSGTNAQMVRLSQDARAILLGRGTITATGETATQVLQSVGLTSPAYTCYAESSMLSPSTVGWENNVDVLLQYLASPGAMDASEIFALHLYAWSAQKALQLYDYFRTHSNYPGTPAWNTESSWAGLPLRQDAAVYVETLFTELANAGVARSYWYAYLYGAPLANSKGLTEAGVGWQQVYKSMH